MSSQDNFHIVFGANTLDYVIKFFFDLQKSCEEIISMGFMTLFQ